MGAAGPNPNFVGNTLTLGYSYNPNFRTARSYQMNIGIQRQIGKGVLTVDYLRNIGLHFQLGIDVNHVGDSRYLQTNAALNAIGLTAYNNSSCAPGGLSAPNYGVTQANAVSVVSCYVNSVSGASINDFANNGLDSGNAYNTGYSVYYAWGGQLTPSTGAAFAGQNPALGNLFMNYPMGRSVYNGLQSEYRTRVSSPFRGVSSLDLQVNYTLSRFVSDGGNDQHFTPNASDFRNPASFSGPTSQDRPIRLSSAAHLNSRIMVRASA